MFVFSAGDYYTFDQLFGERLGIPWPEEVELAELSTFLCECWQAGDIRFNPSPDDRPYTYVDPSHAVRAPSLREAPRRLIGAIFSGPARELFWRRERSHPVGSTALRHTHPDLAQRLTRDRLQDARQTGAELLICEDPATLHELNRFAGDYGLEVRGLYEILAERLVE
jgi:Fe-S oxidoreductase